MSRTARTAPAPAPPSVRCLSSSVLCVLLLCLLLAPAPALGGAVYHLQADIAPDLLGDFAVQPLGACTPAADNDLAGRFFQITCASETRFTMSLFSDNQCATAPLSTVVAPTISDPATGMPRVNQAVVLSTPFMIPIARTYSVWATCNATIPNPTYAYPPFITGVAVGFIASAEGGRFAKSCDEYSRATPVVVMPPPRRLTCPASTNAITQLFVSSTATGKATLNVCTNTAAASLIDSVTVDAPAAKQSSGCSVATAGPYTFAYQFVRADIPISGAASFLSMCGQLHAIVVTIMVAIGVAAINMF